MNDIAVSMAAEIPSTITASGLMLVTQPTFEEVRCAAERGFSRRSVTIGCISVEIAEGEVTRVKHFERVINTVRDVVYDLERDQLRFTGRTSYSYEHSSYNQSSMRTEHTYFQVVLRTKMSESNMYIIFNPHPR